MIIEDILKNNKKEILKECFSKIISTYPKEANELMLNQKDGFANPVGKNIFAGLEEILKEIESGLKQGLSEAGKKRIHSSLEKIIKIRAIQNFSPSQAIIFILFIKNIINDLVLKNSKPNEIIKELLLFHSFIDELYLMSFDIYVQKREKIFDIKVNEVKRDTYQAIKKAGLI